MKEADFDKWGRQCLHCDRPLIDPLETHCVYCKRYEDRLAKWRIATVVAIVAGVLLWVHAAHGL